MTAAIDRAKQYSEDRLQKLRERLTSVVPAQEMVITCGSYARREASEGSDIDFFIVSSKGPSPEGQQVDLGAASWVDQIKDAIHEIVPVEPSEGGAFSRVESSRDILLNIGGERE